MDMAKCGNWPIGVCSWSLQTNVQGVVDTMDKLGLTHVHLGVGPAIGDEGKEYRKAIEKQDWTVSCAMIGFPQEDYSSLDSIKVTGGIAPDDCWETNKKLFFDAVDITADLGIDMLSMHLGFIDHHDVEYAKKFFDRTRCLAEKAADKNITLLLETGQETAADLQQFLIELKMPNVAVNFDPANMILYDKGDPIESVRVLSSWVKHIHIKDAMRSEQIGTWGTEVPWGDGQVGQKAFLETLMEIGYDGTLAIEREAGDQRAEDIKTAIERLSAF